METPIQYQVPVSRSSVVQFVMTCPGMSHSSTFTLHMRDSGEGDDGNVWGDFCREKRVNIAYYESGFLDKDFVVWQGELLRYPPVAVVDPSTPDFDKIPYPWEIFYSFFSNHDIVPVWIPSYYQSAYYEELGRWIGAVGKV